MSTNNWWEKLKTYPPWNGFFGEGMQKCKLKQAFLDIELSILMQPSQIQVFYSCWLKLFCILCLGMWPLLCRSRDEHTFGISGKRILNNSVVPTCLQPAEFFVRWILVHSLSSWPSPRAVIHALGHGGYYPFVRVASSILLESFVKPHCKSW